MFSHNMKTIRDSNIFEQSALKWNFHFMDPLKVQNGFYWINVGGHNTCWKWLFFKVMQNESLGSTSHKITATTNRHYSRLWRYDQNLTDANQEKPQDEKYSQFPNTSSIKGP